jgi:hypothetical protein
MMEAGEQLFLEALEHAKIAGRCRAYAIEHTRAAPGLTKAADGHSSKSEDKLTQWVMGVEKPFPEFFDARTHG